MRQRYAFLVLSAVTLAGRVAAPQSQLDSARFEATVRELELSIIAPCCWRQPVANHNSQVALDIRQEIRKMVADGMTPEQIKADYVRRYGERILAVPPKNAFNQFLWVIPISTSVMAFGVAGYFLRMWRNARSTPRIGREGDRRSHVRGSSFAKVDEELEKWDRA